MEQYGEGTIGEVRWSNDGRPLIQVEERHAVELLSLGAAPVAVCGAAYWRLTWVMGAVLEFDPRADLCCTTCRDIITERRLAAARRG